MRRHFQNDKKILIMIESYNDLSIEKYRELIDIELTDDEVDNITTALSILSDKSVSEIMNLPIPEYNSMIKKMYFLKDKPSIPKRCPKTIVIDGKKYDVIQDAREMTVGQYIDYKQYLKEEDDLIKNLHLILTCFILPEGKSYGDGYSTYELAQVLNENISIVMAMSISNFFFRKSEKYIQCFLTYLEMKTKREMKMEKNKEMKEDLKKTVTMIREYRALLKDGFGLIGASESEKYMAASLMKYLKSKLSSSSI